MILTDPIAALLTRIATTAQRRRPRAARAAASKSSIASARCAATRASFREVNRQGDGQQASDRGLKYYTDSVPSIAISAAVQPGTAPRRFLPETYPGDERPGHRGPLHLARRDVDARRASNTGRRACFATCLVGGDMSPPEAFPSDPDKVKVHCAARPGGRFEAPMARWRRTRPRMMVTSRTAGEGWEPPQRFRAGRASCTGCRARWSSTMVQGSTQDSAPLDISGVGYKAELEGTRRSSYRRLPHRCSFPLPEGISRRVRRECEPDHGEGADSTLGLTAARSAGAGRPSLHQGKGIKYRGRGNHPAQRADGGT